MLPMNVDTCRYLLEMHTLCYPCKRIFVDTLWKWSHGGVDTCRYLMTMNPVCCPCVPILVDTLQKPATSSRQQGCGNMTDAIRTTHSQPRAHDQTSTWLHQETQLGLGSQCLRTESSTVSCVIRMCVYKQYKQCIGEANVRCNCDLLCTRMPFYGTKSLGQALWDYIMLSMHEDICEHIMKMVTWWCGYLSKWFGWQNLWRVL